MNNLRAELDKLEDARLDYVMARSRCNNDSQGIREAGISRATFYQWPTEEREKLNQIAQMLKRDTALKALNIIQKASEEAAKVKVEGLKDRDHRIRQAASTEILDRSIGKSMEKLDLTSGGEPIKPIEVIEIIKHKDDE